MHDKTREAFTEKLEGDEAMLALGLCGCGNGGCADMQLLIRKPRVEPNPENPEELMCVTRLPIFAIPGLVAALMLHYAAHVEEDGE